MVYVYTVVYILQLSQLSFVYGLTPLVEAHFSFFVCDALWFWMNPSNIECAREIMHAGELTRYHYLESWQLPLGGVRWTTSVPLR